MSDSEIIEAFCLIDLDGDGCIKVGELRQALTNLPTSETFSGNQGMKLSSII